MSAKQIAHDLGLIATPNSAYDVVELSRYGSAYLFGEPLGMRGKTSLDTNQWMAGCLPMPTDLEVKHVRCAFIRNGGLIGITDPIWTSSALQFGHMSRVLFEKPVFCLAHPLAFLIAPELLPHSKVQDMLAAWDGSTALEPTIHILGGESFFCRVECRLPSPGLKVFVSLEGPRKVSRV